MTKICYKWGNCNVLWKNADWKWSECRLVEEIISELRPGVPGELLVPEWLREEEPYDPYGKEKRRRFIHLLCKVKDKEYKDKKEVKENIKITVEDVKLVIKAVKGIEIEVIEE